MASNANTKIKIVVVIFFPPFLYSVQVVRFLFYIYSIFR
ncbi:hypothetical protein EVA_11956 [gut metagenome]|uniref:Uncharacterized protein n=1 Tax=gut metagenome TaxID=749906 RepID=J9GDR8_9ZZZZ